MFPAVVRHIAVAPFLCQPRKHNGIIAMEQRRIICCCSCFFFAEFFLKHPWTVTGPFVPGICWFFMFSLVRVITTVPIFIYHALCPLLQAVIINAPPPSVKRW
ncbi:unnamed protein product, partial [Discosporangium mesarthrocarpum]